MTLRPRARPNPASRGLAGNQACIDRLRSLFGLGGASIRDDLEEALADTSTEDDVSPQERALLKNVLALHEVHVGDVMVPARRHRRRVRCIATLADVLEVFRDAGHSRLPVHGETLDDPRGMVHIRDFVAYLAAPKPPDHPQGAGGASAEAPRCEAAAQLLFRARRIGRGIVAGQYSPPGPLRSRVDAGSRSSRENASDAEPIWLSSSTNMAAPKASRRSRISWK